MAISNSQLGAQELLSALISENGTITLSRLDEIDQREPTRAEAEILKQALDSVKNPVLAFQIKKSLRLAVFKLKKTQFKVSLEGLEKLLEDHNRLDDLALGIATVEPAEAFLAADYFRNASWQDFPPQILVSFCNFFRKHGNIADSPVLQDLTRHHDANVITAALTALETLDPGNLQGIIIPLLDSPQNEVKAQAIQAFYRWNRAEALKHLLKLLYSSNEQEVILALHHAAYFPYLEIEPYLIRLLTQTTTPSILMRITQLFKANANPELPFRIFWVNRSLSGQHQSLVKGIILGVVRALADSGQISVSVQEYLNELKNRVKQEEMRLLKATCKVSNEEAEEAILPEIDETPAEPEPLPAPPSDQTSASEDKPIPEPAAPARAMPKPPPPIKAPEVEFDNYSNLGEQERVQLLARANANFFKEYKPRLNSLFNDAQGRELAALINLYGKFGTYDDAARIKSYVKSDNPDIICACIKALSTLDTEYLCLYLPQFMQEKNGKIRMTATRVFVSIDRDRIKGLLTGLLASSNVKQRLLGVSMSMLVDFNIVRQPLLDALVRETSVEMVEKIGLVLSANPDRELLNAVYSTAQNCRSSLIMDHQSVVQKLADNLAIALNHISTAEELLKDAASAYEIEQKALKAAKQEEAKQTALKKSLEFNPIAGDEQGEVSIQDIMTTSSSDPKAKRAKLTIIVWVLVAIVWGGSMAVLVLSYLFGAD
ncbi:MAG: hypothetical protein GQF41_0396 [Candidatus Rifleibacterium amylolyticum]|nr:MAG: hypothetical protein GQF41_0396 [Candidatus Rifleibacterium amylolyticum]